MINNNKETIAVDVDLTVVDTLTSWVNWFEKETDQKFNWFDLNTTSPSNIMERTMKNPQVYWEKNDLYDSLQPEKDSVEVLQRLSERYNIIFVTKSTSGHMMSKEGFLNRNFPFHNGIIHTGNKELVDADYFIDDFDKYLSRIKEGRPASKLLFKRTPANYHQTVDGSVSVCNWRDIDVYFT